MLFWAFLPVFGVRAAPGFFCHCWRSCCFWFVGFFAFGPCPAVAPFLALFLLFMVFGLFTAVVPCPPFVPFVALVPILAVVLFFGFRAISGIRAGSGCRPISEISAILGGPGVYVVFVPFLVVSFPAVPFLAVGP